MGFFSFSKKFTEPLNTAVYTTTHVIRENSPITLVSHEIDGEWQFMGAEAIEDYTKVAMLVSLGNIITHDRSVLKVADLPKGYQAIRKSKSDTWEIAKIQYSDEELREFGYYCSQCGEFHKEIPMAYGSDGPLLYFLIPEDQREERCVLTSDQCVIDEKHFYIRGCLELSVEDNNDNFQWNLWVEVSRPDYDRISEVWEDENRILEPFYHGEIATQLEPYPQTSGLAVKIITRKIGMAPKLELLDSNHPLYFEQQSGIDMNRVTDFAKKILYNH